MDLFDVVRSCIRRWYIVLPLLLIAAWYSHNVYESVKPVYYSNAVIGVAPPNTHVDVAPVGVAVPRNGLLENGGPSLIANMAQLNLGDPSVATQVVAAGGQGNYTAKMFPGPVNSPELPMIMIEATEPDPVAASKTVELVAAQVDPTLRALQQRSGVPDDQMVTSFVVSPPSNPSAGMPSRTRSTITVFVAGAALAILIGVVVDVLLMRWKAHRQKRRQTWVQTAGGANTVDRAHTANEEGNVQRNRHPADEVAMEGR